MVHTGRRRHDRGKKSDESARATGILLRHINYPGHFGLNVPSEYMFTVNNVLVRLSLSRVRTPVEVLDFANEMVRAQPDTMAFQLKTIIQQPSQEAKHFSLMTVKQLPGGPEDTVKSLRPDQFPHRITADNVGQDFRLYKTKHWTELAIIHEVGDTGALTKEESELFKHALDYFVRVYKFISKDERIRYFDDLEEPLAYLTGVVPYHPDEMALTKEAKLKSARKWNLTNPSVQIPYNREGEFDFKRKRLAKLRPPYSILWQEGLL